jgi:hypothetical protein
MFNQRSPNSTTLHAGLNKQSVQLTLAIRSSLNRRKSNYGTLPLRNEHSTPSDLLSWQLNRIRGERVMHRGRPHSQGMHAAVAVQVPFAQKAWRDGWKVRSSERVYTNVGDQEVGVWVKIQQVGKVLEGSVSRAALNNGETLA